MFSGCTAMNCGYVFAPRFAPRAFTLCAVHAFSFSCGMCSHPPPGTVSCARCQRCSRTFCMFLPSDARTRGSMQDPYRPFCRLSHSFIILRCLTFRTAWKSSIDLRVFFSVSRCARTCSICSCHRSQVSSLWQLPLRRGQSRGQISFSRIAMYLRTQENRPLSQLQRFFHGCSRKALTLSHCSK